MYAAYLGLRDPKRERAFQLVYPFNVKASTGEGLGFVGRGEGVAALAIVAVDAA